MVLPAPGTKAGQTLRLGVQHWRWPRRLGVRRKSSVTSRWRPAGSCGAAPGWRTAGRKTTPEDITYTSCRRGPAAVKNPRPRTHQNLESRRVVRKPRGLQKWPGLPNTNRTIGCAARPASKSAAANAKANRSAGQSRHRPLPTSRTPPGLHRVLWQVAACRRAGTARLNPVPGRPRRSSARHVEHGGNGRKANPARARCPAYDPCCHHPRRSPHNFVRLLQRGGYSPAAAKLPLHSEWE